MKRLRELYRSWRLGHESKRLVRGPEFSRALWRAVAERKQKR